MPARENSSIPRQDILDMVEDIYRIFGFQMIRRLQFGDPEPNRADVQVRNFVAASLEPHRHQPARVNSSQNQTSLRNHRQEPFGTGFERRMRNFDQQVSSPIGKNPEPHCSESLASGQISTRYFANAASASSARSDL